MNTTSQVQEPFSDSVRPVRKPSLKHFLVALTVPFVVLLAGVFLLSLVTLLGLILIIVAIAITVGIIMAAVRLKHQRMDAEQAQWRTRTLPLTSLILIVGLAVLLFCIFAS